MALGQPYPLSGRQVLSEVGQGLCSVTRLGSNFVEFFFWELRCNARCNRSHKYPLMVNRWGRSPHLGEHSGILLWVIHRAHHYTSFCMLPFPAPMLLVGALLEFFEVHF